MKRQLIFLYRYITTPGRWRRLLNPQTAMMLTVSAVFLTALAWTAPYSASNNAQEAPQARSTPTLSATALPGGASTMTPAHAATPTRTPLPPEYMDTNPQTIGISLTAVILVIIVVAGAAMFMPKKNEDQ